MSEMAEAAMLAKQRQPRGGAWRGSGRTFSATICARTLSGRPSEEDEEASLAVSSQAQLSLIQDSLVKVTPWRGGH